MSAWTLVRYLIPPPDAQDAEITRWRVFIAILSGVNFVLVIVAFAISFGLTPFFPGFASRDVVIELMQNKWTRDVIELRRHQCFALAQNNEAGARFMSQQMSEMLTKHYRTFGYEKRMPTCEEVGVRFGLSDQTSYMMEKQR